MKRSNGELSWSIFYTKRLEMRKEYRRIFDVPVVKKLSERLAYLIKPNFCVLDVGAGKKSIKRKILEIEPTIDYKSMDIDRENQHDFYSLKDLKGEFDLITLIELVEHLSLLEVLELLEKVKDVLAPNGSILITTPNIFHPTRYFMDVTHKTFFPYDELGAYLKVKGFTQITPFRQFNASLLKKVGIWFTAPIARLYGIDYADTLIIEARK